MATDKQKRPHRIADALGFPEGTVGKGLYIQIYSNRTVNIEGNCNVLNYSDEKVAINTQNSILNICGSDLSISEFGEQNLNITGCIKSVSFC